MRSRNVVEIDLNIKVNKMNVEIDKLLRNEETAFE